MGDFSPSTGEGGKIMLTQKAIEEFQEIYLQTYGKELSFAEAAEQALRLLRFCKFALGYPVHNTNEDGKDE